MNSNTANLSLEPETLPRVMRLRQRFESKVLADIPAAISGQVEALGLAGKVRRGGTVAVACSSRGLTNYPVIVAATVAALKRSGLRPFLVPAMGSHGAATAEGQKRVLHHLGLTEDGVGAPIRSSLEVEQIGATEDNIPVLVDKVALGADHIVLVNRIKKHTDFEGEIESGLVKMMVIGLGKQVGAALYHRAMVDFGYPRIIETVARTVLAKTSILFGVGTVENGYGDTALVEVVPPENLIDREKELLVEAKRLAPRLPFDDADILVIDEMGKEISGSGFDTKVVGRIGLPLITPEPQSPRIKRIVVCDLTAATEGNAVGIGIADFVTQRLVDKIDREALNINAITGVSPEMGRIPVTLASDREAILAAYQCVGLVPPGRLRLIRIKNTMRLGEVEVSEAYREELVARGDLEVVSEARPIHFDAAGNLPAF